MTAEKKKVRMLTEGALVAAMALVLSYVDIPIGLQYGGSIDFVMVPIIIYSVRWGVGCGCALVRSGAFYQAEWR